MQKSASVALPYAGPARARVGKAEAYPADIIRLSPARLSIKSELLFDPDRDATVREFLIRAFGVDEVAEVTFRRRQARVDVRLAPTAIAPEAWRKLAEALRGERSRDATTRDLLAHRVASLRLAESAAETAVRVSRLGDVLTTWRVKPHSSDRLQFSHPALRRRRDILHRFRVEVSTIHGVEAVKTNPLTASVWVNFNPDLIDAEQLVSAVERSWPSLLQETTLPLPAGKLIAAGGLLTLGFTAQFLRPVLKPYAVATVVVYGLPNIIQAARDLSRGKVGLPMLYSAITAMMIASGNPFPSSVMAVFMQSWPRLSERVALGYQRKLFGNARRRFVWARVRHNDGVEIRIDIDRLSAGDIFYLEAGDYIPVDGVVAEGFAAVDEDMLTGVFGAIDKSPGDPVYASTYLRTGTLAVRVLREAGASSANVIAANLPSSPIARLPSSAEVERVAHRNAKPAVAAAALNLIAGGPLQVSQGLIRADYASAPRLSAQLSILTAIADGLRQGIFLRRPAALERLLGAQVYVFDESAGLERSRVAVAEILTAREEDARLVLSIATTAFAKRSDARAKALLAESAAQQIELPHIVHRRRVAGAIRFEDDFGASLEVAATSYVQRAELSIPDTLASLLADANVELHSARDPRDPDIRPLWVVQAGRVIGVVTFERTSPFGASVVETLRSRNPNNRFVYLSHSPQEKARVIAEEAGIETVIGNLGAEAKANVIRDISRRAIWIGDGSTSEAKTVMPASAVSVSIGGVSTLPHDTADVVLLQSDLDGLVTARQMARAHLRRLRTDYRKVYAANAFGTAGAFVLGFASLEANLSTNFGSGLVLASRWSDLRRLARAFAYRDYLRTSTPTEELHIDLDHHLHTKERRDSDIIDFPDPMDAPPPVDGV